MKIQTIPKRSAKEKAGWLLAVAFCLVMAIGLAVTHPDSSIISFDEGFHGGGALAIREYLLYYTRHAVPGGNPHYLVREFVNGIALYPPLWAVSAALFSLIFGASVFVFRLVTSGFYILVTLLIYWAVIRAGRRGGEEMRGMAAFPIAEITLQLK
ncbi:hypothetical protein KGQ71_02005 [Patescibacteria group bacterium]|nr:hypothetical protein [Patescibacteria group bacterium]